MAIDFTSIFDTELERLLVSDENITDVHLSDRELGLRTLALSSEVQSQALLVASDIGKSRARVVIRALRLEGHAASDLGVGPDFPL